MDHYFKIKCGHIYEKENRLNLLVFCGIQEGI